MKRLIMIALSITSLGARVLVDEIVARVNNENIFYSDLREPQWTLGGQPRSIDQCVEDMLFYQKAAEYHAVLPDSDVEKRFVAVREGHGYTYQDADKYEKFLRSIGLSGRKLREQIRRASSIVEIKAFLMPKSALVTREDVEKYCADHPSYNETSYLMSFAVVDDHAVAADGSVDQTKHKVVWTEIDGWLKESELAGDMGFVSAMQPGDVSRAIKKSGNYFLYRLEKTVPRHLKTVEERTAEVESILLEQRRKEKEIDVKKNLRKQAAIKVF